MKRLMIFAFILFLGLPGIPGKSNAQYLYNDDGFIGREFFFKPASVSPDNLGIFGEIAPWFFDHPLQDASLNPARLGENIQSNNYFYTDFRSLPRIERSLYRFPSEHYSFLYSCRCIFPYPATKVKSRTDEPLFNAAWIHRLSGNENLVIGVMYSQNITSDRYYDNFYIGGYYLTGSSSVTDIPDVDLVRRQYDRFRQQGYFPSFMASLRLSDHVITGIKAGISYYNGHGTLHDGRVNVNEVSIWRFAPSSMNESTNLSSSLTSQMVNTFIDRGIDQRYYQWEGAAGVQVDIPDIGLAGLTAGFLYGDVDQLLGIDHYFVRSEGERYIDQNWFRHSNVISISENWQRSGYHYYGSADFQRWIGDENNDRFQLFYRLGRTSLTTDRSGTENTINNYGYETTYAAAPETRAILWSGSINLHGIDGNGTEKGWDHRMGVTSQIKLGGRSVLLFGLQFSRRTETRRVLRNSDMRWNTESELRILDETELTYYRSRRITTRLTENRDRVNSLYIPASLRVSASDRLLIDTGVLLLLAGYNFKEFLEETIHLYMTESSEEGYNSQPYSHKWSWNEKEDETIAAIMVGIGYRVLPDVRIRLAGVAGTGSREMRDDIAVPRSTRQSDRLAVNKTRIMLGLEAGF